MAGTPREQANQPNELLALLERVGAIKTGHFVLASGRHSDKYVEKFDLLRQPAATQLALEPLARRFKDERIDVVNKPVFHQVAIWGSVISFSIMILVVALQVFARFVLTQAPPWTEEASRICFIYLIAFGIGVAVRSDGMVKLDLHQRHADGVVYKLLQAVIHLVIAAFSVCLTVLSWQYAASGGFETSPSLGIPMSFVFASMVLLSVSIVIFSVEKLLLTLSGLKLR